MDVPALDPAPKWDEPADVTPTRQGSFKLFRFAGIQVYLHWSWFLVAWIEISQRSREYSSVAWNIAEYVALFATVLLHEFGHALAARSVGGTSEQIVLWPLGGVAYVAAPPRPGAQLWSIAAGPLVNAVLLPLFLVISRMTAAAGWTESNPNAQSFLVAMVYINGGLLLFNLLPIYPLDGGQILRSLLWFPLGRAKSLMVASLFGFLGVGALGLLALYVGSIWYGIMAGFVAMNCWRGWQEAKILSRVEKWPRRAGYQCPSCSKAPPVGPFWRCGACGGTFDTFESFGGCPGCGMAQATTGCPECGNSHPMAQWRTTPPPVSTVILEA